MYVYWPITKNHSWFYETTETVLSDALINLIRGNKSLTGNTEKKKRRKKIVAQSLKCNNNLIKHHKTWHLC